MVSLVDIIKRGGRNTAPPAACGTYYIAAREYEINIDIGYARMKSRSYREMAPVARRA